MIVHLTQICICVILALAVTGLFWKAVGSPAALEVLRVPDIVRQSGSFQHVLGNSRSTKPSLRISELDSNSDIENTNNLPSGMGLSLLNVPLTWV